MPLNDIDLIHRRSSIGFPIDLIDIIVYSYNEQTFEEKYFRSINGLINLLNKDPKKTKSYWIEVINRSSIHLPNSIKLLCEYFDIHSLTIEDITTLTPYMKIDFFDDQSSIYLLMKIISWNHQRVEQQQISFYLKSSQNILITFQEKSTNDQSIFDPIRNYFRREEQSSFHRHNRLKTMKIDYLFYCLIDAIIDRYKFVVEEIAPCIYQFDQQLMMDKKILTSETLHSIYHLKHDLLHLKILFNPLKEIIFHLQRITEDDRFFLYPPKNHLLRLDMRHRIIRRQVSSSHYSPRICSNTTDSSTQSRRKSIFLNEKIFIYLNDLNDNINQLTDSLEIQRENISNLVSLWITLNSNETQKTLKFLMLITVIFMPCVLLTSINSTNYKVQPHLGFKYGYYIVLILLATIITGMITWYKLKRWI